MGINPTELSSFAEVGPPNEVGQPTFIEVIILDPFNGTTHINRDFPLQCLQICNIVTSCTITKDLFDPSTLSRVSQAALRKGVNDLSLYRVFYRDFITKQLTETTMDAPARTKDSIVFIDRTLLVSQSPLTGGCSQDASPLNRAIGKISKVERLPTRFLWP
jgi:hypothetical protein